MTIKFNTNLNCGCCGVWFRTWEGYEDQDQDEGFGICSSCQADADFRESEIMDGLIDQFNNALSEEDRTKFATMDRELKEAFVTRAINDGAMTFSLGGDYD